MRDERLRPGHSGGGQHAFDIASEKIDLDVDARAGAQRGEARVCERVRNEVHGQSSASHFVDSEADAVDRDRAFTRNVSQHILRHGDREEPVIPDRLESLDECNAVDMAAHEVASQPIGKLERFFQIDCCALLETGHTRERFARHVDVESTFVEGDDSEIPFSELPRLGGPNRLRGYPLDRFRDEKAAVGTVEYHYPIHQFVAGALYVDVGKVAKSYGDFLNSNWKVGGGGGFIVRSRDNQLFTFDIAYGEGVQFHLTTDPLRAFSKRDSEL